MPKLIDISPRIDPGTAVWPGDAPFAWERVAAIARGETVNLGRMSLSPHTGAHVDAPLHLEDGAPDVASLSLEAFWGPARVVDWVGRGALDRAPLSGLDWTGVERVLFRTRRRGEPLGHGGGYPGFTPEGARFLCKRGLKLVGVDAPSVDPFESADLPAHRVFARARTATLECLELAHVEPGDYELVALPLRIAGADGSPVRAVLRTPA